jgi:hypothetical protein
VTASSIEELLHSAWGVIANAGGGDWKQESLQWQEAAKRWRDRYHKHLTDLRPIEEQSP